jgi:hypothetical protein
MQFDEEFVEVTDKKYRISKMLKSNLDFENKRVAHDWDSCILVTGNEGTGKTTLAASIAYYNGYNHYTNSSNFTLDWIVFTLEDFEEAAKKAGPGQTILWDEFALAGLSTDVLTKIQKKLTKIFIMYRFKKLKYILIIPSIWLLGWYFATHRTSCLIHCYSPDGLQRGFFRFYNRQEKSILYFTGTKLKTYKQAKCSFDGKYGIKSLNEIGIDVEAYNKRKIAAAHRLLDDDDVSGKQAIAIYKLLNFIKSLKDTLSLKDIVEKSGMGLQYGSVRNLISRMREKEEYDKKRIQKIEEKELGLSIS